MASARCPLLRSKVTRALERKLPRRVAIRHHRDQASAPTQKLTAPSAWPAVRVVPVNVSHSGAKTSGTKETLPDKGCQIRRLRLARPYRPFFASPGTSYRLRRNASRRRRMRWGREALAQKDWTRGGPDPSVTKAPRLSPLARDVAPHWHFYGGAKFPCHKGII